MPTYVIDGDGGAFFCHLGATKAPKPRAKTPRLGLMEVTAPSLSAMDREMLPTVLLNIWGKGRRGAGIC